MEAKTPDMCLPPRSCFSMLVAPASCRLSRGHLALAGGDGTPPTTAAGTAALREIAPQWIGYTKLALLPARGHTTSFTGLPDLSFCHCARTMEWPTCNPCSLAAVENLGRPQKVV